MIKLEIQATFKKKQSVEYKIYFKGRWPENLEVLDSDNFLPFLAADEMRKSLLLRIIKNNQVFQNITIDI